MHIFGQKKMAKHFTGNAVNRFTVNRFLAAQSKMKHIHKLIVLQPGSNLSGIKYARKKMRLQKF